MPLPYVTRNEVLSKISNSDFVPFLDDNGDGIEDPGLLDNIIAVASNAADAFVASIYKTPFTEYVPAKIHDAALVFTVEMLYQRRLAPTEQNIFKPQADMWREILKSIGTGQIPLDANVTRVVTPGFAITYESRLSVDTDGNPVSLM